MNNEQVEMAAWTMVKAVVDAGFVPTPKQARKLVFIAHRLSHTHQRDGNTSFEVERLSSGTILFTGRAGEGFGLVRLVGSLGVRGGIHKVSVIGFGPSREFSGRAAMSFC